MATKPNEKVLALLHCACDVEPRDRTRRPMTSALTLAQHNNRPSEFLDELGCHGAKQTGRPAGVGDDQYSSLLQLGTGADHDLRFAQHPA
jgi:hypothetical protein